MENKSAVAFLITCFNRKSKTLTCLKNIFSSNSHVDVYVVDDKSSDGTSNAIAELFPQVKIILGSGDLYWNRGMGLAWLHAAKLEYDFYIWMNDDTFLCPDFMEELLFCAEITKRKCIISGIVDSHDHREILYGGTDAQRNLLLPTGQLQSIFNMNGNIVLIPRFVYQILGNLDLNFHHDLGDVDYGLRARQQGIEVLTTRKVVGSCEKNELCRIRQPNTNLRNRFVKLYSPLGSHPKINFYFRNRHYGLINAMLYYIFLHVINVFPDGVVRLFFGDRYK